MCVQPLLSHWQAGRLIFLNIAGNRHSCDYSMCSYKILEAIDKILIICAVPGVRDAFVQPVLTSLKVFDRGAINQIRHMCTGCTRGSKEM